MLYSHSGTGTKRKRIYDDKISDWAAGRASLVEMQREAFEQRQRQEIAMRKEEFEKKLKLELEILEFQKAEQAAKTALAQLILQRAQEREDE